MYKIKQQPKDFIVDEISNIAIKEKGNYLIYKLKKINYTTLRAIITISDKLKIPLKTSSS